MYGIRPEHFRLADDGVEAIIQVIEPTGSEIVVSAAKLGGVEIIAVFRERHQFKPGDSGPAQAGGGASLAHLFDEMTGQRLNAKTQGRKRMTSSLAARYCRAPPRCGAGALSGWLSPSGRRPWRRLRRGSRSRSAAVDAAVEVFRAVGG